MVGGDSGGRMTGARPALMILITVLSLWHFAVNVSVLIDKSLSRTSLSF